MTPAIRIGAACALAACMAGCAMPPPNEPSAFVVSPRKNVVRAERVHAIVIGKSTRADVVAALGDTLAISFDTGYEVWVYRLADQREGEFVILFSPSGVVAKTRMRGAQPRG